MNFDTEIREMEAFDIKYIGKMSLFFSDKLVYCFRFTKQYESQVFSLDELLNYEDFKPYIGQILDSIERLPKHFSVKEKIALLMLEDY